MSLDNVNNGDVHGFSSHGGTNPTIEPETPVEARTITNNNGSTESKTDKVRKMLRAGFKAAEIHQALGVAMPYIYRIKGAVKVEKIQASDPAPRVNLQIQSDETLTEARTRTRKQNMVLAMFHYKGIVTDALKSIGLTHAVHLTWLREDAEYAQRIHDAQESAIDWVETQLFKQVKAGVPSSTQFYLKTKAKHRGYTERTEITGAEGGPIEVRVIEPYIDPLADIPDVQEGEYEMIEPGENR